MSTATPSVSSPQTIGGVLRYWRGQAQLSQRELSERLQARGFQITLQAISHYENGLRTPSIEFLGVAADELEIPNEVLQGFFDAAASAHPRPPSSISAA